MTLESQLDRIGGSVFLLLWLERDLALKLTVQIDALEDGIRSARWVNSAQGKVLLAVEEESAVALQLELRNRDVELLHEQVHDVVDLCVDVESHGRERGLLEVNNDELSASFECLLRHVSGGSDAKTRTEAKHEVGVVALSVAHI